MKNLLYSVLFIAFTATSTLMAATYEKVTVLSQESAKEKNYVTADQVIEVITFSDLTDNNLEDFFYG